MARIAGVTLPNEKRVEIALTYIFGIGLKKAMKPSGRVAIRATALASAMA